MLSAIISTINPEGFRMSSAIVRAENGLLASNNSLRGNSHQSRSRFELFAFLVMQAESSSRIFGYTPLPEPLIRGVVGHRLVARRINALWKSETTERVISLIVRLWFD